MIYVFSFSHFTGIGLVNIQTLTRTVLLYGEMLMYVYGLISKN